MIQQPKRGRGHRFLLADAELKIERLEQDKAKWLERSQGAVDLLARTIKQLEKDKAELVEALEHSLSILAQGDNIARGLTGRAHTVLIKVDKGYAMSAFKVTQAVLAKHGKES